jgi:hypothetical protein
MKDVDNKVKTKRCSGEEENDVQKYFLSVWKVESRKRWLGPTKHEATIGTRTMIKFHNNLHISTVETMPNQNHDAERKIMRKEIVTYDILMRAAFLTSFRGRPS